MNFNVLGLISSLLVHVSWLASARLPESNSYNCPYGVINGIKGTWKVIPHPTSIIQQARSSSSSNSDSSSSSLWLPSGKTLALGSRGQRNLRLNSVAIPDLSNTKNWHEGKANWEWYYRDWKEEWHWKSTSFGWKRDGGTGGTETMQGSRRKRGNY